MAFEATKNLAGARQVVKAANMELEALDGYSSPAFGNIGGGARGGMHSDRVVKMVMKRDRARERLASLLDTCLHLEEASQAELDTVASPELRAMITYREVHGMTWAQIGKEMDMSADAAKKRYERNMKAYLGQGIKVEYPQDALDAVGWLRRAAG